MLESGKPKHLGKTYRRPRAEKLLEAHQAALDGGRTSPVRPPNKTTTLEIMTIEEHEAKQLNWRMETQNNGRNE